MNTADRVLALKLVTDVGDINKSLKGVNKDAKRTGDSFRKMGTAAKSWGKAIGGAFVISGLAALPGIIGDLNQGFKDGEQASRNLGITWKNLGLDAGKLAGTIDDISGMALDMGFDDAEVVSAFDTFLGLTGDSKLSADALAAALDLARAKGWPLGKAVKYVSKHLGDLDGALETNTGKAKAWADSHPIEVTAGKITDALENVVGALGKGDWDAAMTNLQTVGSELENLLFGNQKSIDIGNGITVQVRTGGLIDRFREVGGKLVTAVVDGLGELGPKIQTWWTDNIATVDWLTAVQDGIGNVFAAITADPDKSGNVALAGAAIVAALVVPLKLAGWAADALSAAFKLPSLIVTEGVKILLKAVGVAAAWGIRAGMVTLSIFEGAIRILASGLKTSLGTGGVLRAVMMSVGASVAGGIVAGVVAAFSFQWVIDAIGDAIRGAARQAGLDNDLPLGPGDLPWMQRELGGAAHGWTMVGEGGPELLRLPAGSRVFSNTDSRAMLAGAGASSGASSTVINVSISAGVGDPVEIGRQVDRVLRVYRKRAGILSAGQMV